MKTNRKVYAYAHEIHVAEMPYSEVCMHMGVAGKLMGFRIPEVGSRSVQLYELRDGKLVPFSAPILKGEAGLYSDEDGDYYYPPMW